MTTEVEPMTPEQLAEYDAETVRVVMGADRLCSAAESEWEYLKIAAANAKKLAEGQVAQLRQTIREREENRGKRPAPTLLDMLTTKADTAAWRAVPIDSLDIERGVKAHMSFEPIKTAGELFDVITSFDPADGTPFGLAIHDVAAVRMVIQQMIDAENPPQQPTIPEDLWRAFPLAQWTRFGMTAKDVEKLAAGEVKRETGRRPVVTVGDLSDFTKPTAGGYSRVYADIKGIGTAGADRISDAEGEFWAWWRNGGEESFAAERGVTGGNAPSAGDRSEGVSGGAVIVAGPDPIELDRLHDDGAPVFEPPTPEALAADDEARNNCDFSR